jgi:hypothetical protein
MFPVPVCALFPGPVAATNAQQQAVTMAGGPVDVKLFGKWTYEDVQVGVCLGTRINCSSDI